MKHYIKALQKISEAQLAELDIVSRHRSVEWEPLEIQISRWWTSLPPVLQLRKYQITEIAAQCKGRFSTKPALRQVATSLRALGWIEKRDWSVMGRNKRYWTNSSFHKTLTSAITMEDACQIPIDSHYALQK